MTWREHEGEECRVWRDEGTRSERVVGWLLAYPVRVLIVTFVLVVLLTTCGL